MLVSETLKEPVDLERFDIIFIYVIRVETSSGLAPPKALEVVRDGRSPERLTYHPGIPGNLVNSLQAVERKIEVAPVERQIGDLSGRCPVKGNDLHGIGKALDVKTFGGLSYRKLLHRPSVPRSYPELYLGESIDELPA